jgi:hypothetical protein
MLPMRTQAPLQTNAAMLEPPRGYRPLAWLGLTVNVLVLPVVLLFILQDPHWRAVHIAVGAGGVLPTSVVGIVACVALLRWRLWGQVVAIVALSMSLALSLPYGIVRLVLVASGRPLMAVVAPLLWLINIAILVFWCQPAIRRYLR